LRNSSTGRSSSPRGSSKGRFPAILDDPKIGSAARELYDSAQTLLKRIIDEKLITAKGGYGFWPANTEGDDIVLYRDESRREVLQRLPMLRQQEVIADKRPNRSLADFIAPRASAVPDCLGMFAVTGGLGADELAILLTSGGEVLQRRSDRPVAVADPYDAGLGSWRPGRPRVSAMPLDL
jgi:cobalamin-dependent methionine synthase I